MNKILNTHQIRRTWFLWLLATIAGTYLVFISVERISQFIWSNTEHDYDSRWLFGTLGFFIGIILGFFQWFILRSSVVGAYSWIFITPTGLGIGLFAGLNFALAGHASIIAVWYIATIVIVVLNVVNLLALFSVRSE
jgi:hypothetical protein